MFSRINPFNDFATSDGGCFRSYPTIPDSCDCQPNPTVSKFAACNSLNQPLYFDDLNDIPNDACIQYANGQSTGISLTTCQADSDCIDSLTCSEGMCVDGQGVKEANRRVTTCVSPKKTSDNVMAGCPYGGGQGDLILQCHQYWISDEGMQWKRYLQHNPLGKGETYAWAYDEAVCSISGNQRGGQDYPWCVDQDSSKSAVDGDGNVTDQGCPCTVYNNIAPLNAVPFADQGYGEHMFVHVYEIMSAEYVPPTEPASFTPVTIPEVESEKDEFYLKVVNQFQDEILVYMDAPPARQGEYVSGGSVTGAKWEGWQGPTRSLRGETQPFLEDTDSVDAWVSRITIAPNDDPSNTSQPIMRVAGDGSPLGGFYVPADHHLRIQIATQESGGWFQTRADCPNTACFGPGTSLWLTRGDAYSYPDRDPLLLIEPNVNDFQNGDFASGTIWFDVSAVDGINSNFELIYGKIDRTISVPLFQSNDFNKFLI